MSSPIKQREAGRRQLYQDALQEMHLICIILKEEKDIRKISNETKKISYNFWKNYGYRKIKNKSKNATWAKIEVALDSDSAA